jgi:hypothetical protein
MILRAVINNDALETAGVTKANNTKSTDVSSPVNGTNLSSKQKQMTCMTQEEIFTPSRITRRDTGAVCFLMRQTHLLDIRVSVLAQSGMVHQVGSTVRVNVPRRNPQRNCTHR